MNPGTWQLVLGPYTVAPQGLAWWVEVTLGDGPPGPAFVPDPAPARAGGRGRGWYRGDLHTHTVHSDGTRTPAELAAAARAAGLDFVASTEHNTTSASLGWGGHAGPDLLVIDGEEVTTRDGHWLALGLPPGAFVDWRYRAADGVLDRVLAGLHGRGGLAVAAHPFCPLPGCAWRFGYRGLDAVEVWNGPWTPDDEAALARWDRLLAAGPLPAGGGRQRRPRPPTTGSATPRRWSWPTGWTGGRSCAAWPPGAAGWPGRPRSTWAWRRPPAGRSAGIGERLEAAPGQEVTVRLRVRGAAGGLARLRTGAGPVLEARLAGDGEAVEWTTTPAATAWVRAEVRRPPAAAGAPGTWSRSPTRCSSDRPRSAGQLQLDHQLVQERLAGLGGGPAEDQAGQVGGHRGGPPLGELWAATRASSRMASTSPGLTAGGLGPSRERTRSRNASSWFGWSMARPPMARRAPAAP